MKRIALNVGVPIVLVTTITTVGASTLAQATDRPKIGALFSAHIAPAFWVECRNLTERNINLA